MHYVTFRSVIVSPIAIGPRADCKLGPLGLALERQQRQTVTI